MGIEKIGTIQTMPILLMQKVLGENGAVIWRKANGIDNNPVEPHSEAKSMSTEDTFDRDTTDVVHLKRVLTMMVEKLAYKLRREQKVTGCVTLKLRYSDFQTHTFQKRISYTASDDVILQTVLELFERNFSRRVLIRLIGVRFSNLVSGFNQINLFEDTEEKISLYQAMDKIRNRFGDQAIMRSIGLDKP